MRVAATTRPASSSAAAPLPLFLLLAVAAAAAALFLVGSASLAMAGHVLGGAHDAPSAANSVETDALARFAVDEHNKREVKPPPPPPPPSLSLASSPVAILWVLNL